MLNQEQLEQYAKWVNECESVMDAHGLIYDNLGRSMTKEEMAQLMAYQKNRGPEAQLDISCRNYEDAPAEPIIIPVEKTGILSTVDKTVRIQELANQLAETYRRKNADYGDSFGISVRKYGIIAALTRMSDKWNRLENLILNMNKNSVPNVSDESVLDTLLDLATYCMMTIMEIEEGV